MGKINFNHIVQIKVTRLSREQEDIKAAIVDFMLNHVRYQLLIEKEAGKWKPRYVYHIEDGSDCLICKEKQLQCHGFKEHMHELYEKIEPKIRLKLIYV